MADKDETEATDESTRDDAAAAFDPVDETAFSDRDGADRSVDDVEDPSTAENDELPDELRDESDPESDLGADPEADSDGEGNPETSGEPVPVGAGATAGGVSATRPRRRTGEAATRPQRKTGPTAQRDGGQVKPKRTGPVTFVRESVAELRKVVYPTGPQLLNYFVVVLVFVLFIIGYVSLLDLGFGAAILRIFS